MLRTKWVRLNDFLLIFLSNFIYKSCPSDRHGTTKEMTMMIIRFLSQPFSPWQMTFFDWFSLMSHNYTLYYWKFLQELFFSSFLSLRSIHCVIKNSSNIFSITAWRLYIFRNNLVTQLPSHSHSSKEN